MSWFLINCFLSLSSPLGRRVTERFPTTTMKRAAGTSARSICSTRAPPTEDTASSRRSQCSPSGPKLMPSSSSTHPGSCRDPGWTSVEVLHHHRYHRRHLGTGSIPTLTESLFPEHPFWHKLHSIHIEKVGWGLIVKSWIVNIQFFENGHSVRQTSS